MIIILALTGIVAVREQALLAEAEAGGGVSAFPPDMGGGGAIPEGDFGGGGVIEGDPGIGGEFGPPPGFDAGGGAAGGAAETSVTANLTTALLAASNILIGWGFLIVLLCEVSLFNGRAPRLGQNFHIAIWATVPLAVMAGLKLLFYASGGEVGQGGIAGIVTEMPFYAGLSGFAQSLTLSLASRLTLFWLWSLILIYFGARYALNGKRAAALLVVVMWVVVLVVAPVATGAINATAGLTTETITPEGMEGMPDGMSPEGGDFSGLMGEAGMPEGMEIIPGEFSEGEVQELPEGFSSDSESEGSEVINGAATGELSGAEGEAPEDETVTDEISSGGGGGGGSASGGGSSAGGASGGGGGSSAPAPSVNVEPAQSEAEAAPPPARSMKG